MNNLVYSLRTPYTAATALYRCMNFIIGAVIALLLILLVFNALVSDIGRRQAGADIIFNRVTDPLEYSSGPLSCNLDGMGLILFPMLSDKSLLFPSVNKGDRVKPAEYDTTVYLLHDAVDRRPELIWMIYPDLKPEFTAEDSEDQVVLNILVNYDGRVLEANLDDDPNLDGETIRIILKSASSSLFKPALVNDRPVKCWVQIPLELVPEV